MPTHNFRLEPRCIARGCDELRNNIPSFSSSNLRVSRQLLVQQQQLLLLTSHRKATDVKVHNQMFRNAIPKFTNGRAVLIGDAAHFMLPSMSLLRIYYRSDKFQHTAKAHQAQLKMQQHLKSCWRTRQMKTSSTDFNYSNL